MLQTNDIRFHCHGPIDRQTFGSLGIITYLTYYNLPIFKINCAYLNEFITDYN
jgi:hypothetical protein